jgi:hypothetical protein
MLETLAETRANASAPLGMVVRNLLVDRLSPLRSQTLTLVSMTLDRHMTRALLGLREDGVKLAFLYVPGFSFGGGAISSLLPFLPGEASRSHAPAPEMPADIRALLLSLSSAGVRCLTLKQGDDLAKGLSAWQGGRPGRAAAGGTIAP